MTGEEGIGDIEIAMIETGEDTGITIVKDKLYIFR